MMLTAPEHQSLPAAWLPRVPAPLLPWRVVPNAFREAEARACPAVSRAPRRSRGKAQRGDFHAAGGGWRQA